jgi:hypothetical protein
VLVSIGVFAGIAFGIGYSDGNTHGLQTALTINQAMAAGPKAAAAWSMLMEHNNPLADLATCEKNISRDQRGQTFCAMPVWLDPEPVAGGS